MNPRPPSGRTHGRFWGSHLVPSPRHLCRGSAMKRTGVLVTAAGLLAAAAGFLIAQDKSAPPAAAGPPRPADEQAIREASQAFARAFEKGDAAALAALFTEQAEYVDDG